MIDVVNEELIEKGKDPIHFDHDCREGICGMCSMVIDGVPHGHQRGTTVCQLHMRHFKDGEHVFIEPWRARAFPILKDLVVDRSALDRIIQAGGFVSVNAGGAPDANAILIRKADAESSMDAAACIGCGACIAACKNASAMLFVAAKSRTWRSCRRDRRNVRSVSGRWWHRWITRDSAIARIILSVKPCARRK